MGSQEKWTTEFDLSWVAVVCTHQIFSKSFKKLHQKWIFIFSGAAHEWLRSFRVAFQLITPSASKYFTGTSGWVSW
jgi:hypothetical protein